MIKRTGILFGALVAVLCSALWQTPALAQFARGPVPVFAQKVQPHEIVDRVEALGTLRANEMVTLTATVAERISAIHFSDGQRVEAGHVLVEMTSREEAALLAEAQATLEEAHQQYDRVRTLQETGYATGTSLDERRRQYETAQAQLDATRSRLEDRLVIAPFAGLVGLREVSVGALIQPGTVITTLHDDSVMKLDFSVPERFLGDLQVGLPVQASSVAMSGRMFDGTISAIDARIDPVTRSVVVRALIPNEDRALRAGLLMTVQVQKAPRTALMISEEAVVPLASDFYVYVVARRDSGTVAERRRVIVGSRQPGVIEVVQGLVEGDLVITDGSGKIHGGQAITVKALDDGSRPLTDMLRDAAASGPVGDGATSGVVR